MAACSEDRITERAPSDVGGQLWQFFDKGQHPDTHWRHYRLNGERFTPNGLEICSVTQALGALDKPALVGWAANVTVQGCWELAGRKGYRRPNDLVKVNKAGEEYTVPGWRILQQKLKAAGLDHNSTRDEAALRGSTVHDMREAYVKDGTIPDASKHPEAWRGYITSMIRYIMWCEKRGLVPESVEVVVGSATHGFAGACDFVGVATGPDGERERHDYKTSKQAYAKSHFRQLGAYDGAATEMGIEPCSKLGVVILPADGEWNPKDHISYAHEVEWPNGGPYESFLNVLKVWRDNRPLEKYDDATYRAAKKRATNAAKAAK